jgi:7-cyano-7-deazaguanine synthase
MIDHAGQVSFPGGTIEPGERCQDAALRELGEELGVDRSRVELLGELSKREIVERGLALGVDYAITLTCYDPAPDGAACGRCEACLIRLKGFREAGMDDPAPYQTVAGEAI